MTVFLDAVKLPDWLFAGVDVRFIAVGVGVAIIAADAFLRHRRGSQQQFHAAAAAPFVAVTPVSTESLVTATPPMTEALEPIKDKPSIAVLPFVNMSDDKSQEYFADGMTEDIITGLSCDSRLFVIARNSTFAYKGQSPDIRTLGKELGVRYVLEGSIRPVGERLRITMQLIETASGTHVWADKIDRPVAEMFQVMDEVVDGLVTTLCSNLNVAEGKRAARVRPEDLQAWALCVQAETIYFLRQSAGSVTAAESLLRRATEIEPGYGASWALLAFITSLRRVFAVRTDPAKDTDAAVTLADKALSVARHDPLVLGYCGAALAHAGQTARAIDCLERSLESNPNSSVFRLFYGAALNYDGRPEAGITQLDMCLRLSPKDPNAGLIYFFSCFSHLALHDFPQAEQAARKTVKLMPSYGLGYILLSVSLTALGRGAEAQQQLQTARQVTPVRTRQMLEDFWCVIFRQPEDAEKLIALLRQVWRD